MNQITNGFINRAYRIRIQGNIDQKLTDSISGGLQKCWPYRPTALLVTINSSGGSIVQAKNIADLLRLYSNRYNIPIVTFAEDACLNSANVILTAGVKCYASPFSMIGDMGYVWSTLWFNRFAKKYDVKKEFVYSPQNKVKFNPFEEIKPESEKWMKNYVYEMEHELKTALTNNRSEHFLKNGLTKESVEEKVFAPGILDPQQYVRLGLIDGLRTYDQQIKEKYSGVEVRQINQPAGAWKDHLQLSMLLF